jgi:hypothetical protein
MAYQVLLTHLTHCQLAGFEIHNMHSLRRKLPEKLLTYWPLLSTPAQIGQHARKRKEKNDIVIILSLNHAFVCDRDECEVTDISQTRIKVVNPVQNLPSISQNVNENHTRC